LDDKLLKIREINIGYGDSEIKIYKIKLKDRGLISALRNNIHHHKYYEVHLAMNGDIIFSNLSRKVVKVPEGHLLIIPPGTIHSAVEAYTGNSLVLEFVVKKTEGTEGFYDFFEQLFNNSALLPIKTNRKLIEMVNAFHQYDFNDTIAQYITLNSLCSEIISLLCETLNSATIKKAFYKNEKSDIIAKIDVLVNVHEYSVADIAQIIGYSERHTARLIQDIYGMTLSEIRHRYMIETAKELLLLDISIEEIVTMCNFSSASQMRNLFRKYEGIAPSEYKKSKPPVKPVACSTPKRG